MAARVTLQTIADRLGVSRMTVSNAFSRPDQLSADLRQRILDAADTLGYVGPDPAARALARGSTGAVGVLFTDELHYAFSDDVATTFLGAVTEELAPTGLALTMFTSVGTDDVVPARDVAVDGALVYACLPDSPALDWLRRRRIPLVLVDQPPGRGVPSVNIDDRGGARAGARHLLELGHRHIAIVSPEPTVQARAHPVRQRMLGWLDELDAAGVTPTMVREPHPPLERSGALRDLLTTWPRPTAALCYSDAIALSLVRDAEELGLHVPHDLSVVGFDDSPLIRRMRPALTTVRQDVAAKGRAAAAALVAAIGRGDDPPTRARHLVLPTELVVRNSTTAPNEGAHP